MILPAPYAPLEEWFDSGLGEACIFVSLVAGVRKAAISPLFLDHQKGFDMIFIY
jgi:hypothetical protein